MTHDIRYLVAWAGDKRSQDALVLGAVLARTFNASLEVLYVLVQEEQVTLQHAGEANFRNHAVEQVQERLDAAVAHLDADLPVRTHLRVAGSVVEGIVGATEELHASLVVIGAGSGGGRPVASPIVGSLLHASPVPVAMAPRGYRRNTFARLDELACAVGTRPGAQQVVEEAVEGVARVGLPLRLISLVDLGGKDDAGAAATAQARRSLDEAESAVAGRCAVSTEVGEGKNLKQAVKRISWNPGSALMVGSSRLAGGRRTFVGTTATRMLINLPIPMIIVPAPEATSGVSA